MSILPHSKFRSSSNKNKVERNFYKVWSEMCRRCRQKLNNKADKSYYDKGIRVCPRWRDFNNFFIDMWDDYLVHRSMFKTTQIDRIDNSKGYSKENCKWSTREENMNNTDTVRMVQGKTLAEWSKEIGVRRGTLVGRYEQGKRGKQLLSSKLVKEPNKLFKGKTRMEWARKLKISRTTMYERLRRGWSIEKALSTPKFNPHAPRKKRAASFITQ